MYEIVDMRPYFSDPLVDEKCQIKKQCSQQRVIFFLLTELWSIRYYISAITFHRTMVTAALFLMIPFYHTVPQRDAHALHHRLELKPQFWIKRNRIRYIIIHKDALRNKHA